MGHQGRAHHTSASSSSREKCVYKQQAEKEKKKPIAPTHSLPALPFINEENGKCWTSFTIYCRCCCWAWCWCRYLNHAGCCAPGSFRQSAIRQAFSFLFTSPAWIPASADVNKKNPCPFFSHSARVQIFARRWEREEKKAEGIEDSLSF